MAHAAAPIPLHPVTRAAVAHNLPAHFTSFVGRERDRAEIALILRGTARLVTLTGVGGIGKTRLAQEVSADLLGDFRDGVWLAELGPLLDGRRVPLAVAAALGIQDEPGCDLTETLVAALRPRQVLVVLDNCEHLLAASADLVVRLLSRCPGVAILATSREPLGMAGETTWRLPSLERPDPHQHLPLERLLEIDSIRLFTERATAAWPDFRPAEHVAAMAQICARLDGIPLALELAAARVATLGPSEIAARLDDRFRLLALGSRSAPPRQQTLRAAIDWSYELLGDEERRLFERLAVFAGGWTLAAAESTCGGDGIDPQDVVDLLSRLVSKSLVSVDDGAHGTRWYRLLETVRAYGVERLRASGVEVTMRARHLDAYTDFAVDSDRILRRATGLTWDARTDRAMQIERAIDNFRAAWQWSLTGGDAQQGLRLTASLLAFFYSIGYLSEGREWFAHLLARTADALPTPERAMALSAASKLAAHHGDDSAALEYAAEYQALPQAVCSAATSADVEAGLAIAYTRQGDLSVAYTHGCNAVGLALEGGDPLNATMYRSYAATALLHAGKLDEAAALYEQSLAEARALDFQIGVALALVGLASVARAQRDMPAGRRLYEEALTVFRRMGAPVPATQALTGLGHAALDLGDLAAARRAFDEALELSLAIGQRQHTLDALDGLVLVAAAEHHYERVLRMLGATAALRAATGSPALDATLVADARAHVGPGRARVLVDEGAGMTLERAIGCARGDGSTAPRASGHSGLTERELQVVQLLGRGQGNRAIARELVISVRTVDRHVENILGKLGLGSRGQIVVWAAERGLLDLTRQ